MQSKGFIKLVAVLLALPETVKSLMKQSVWPLESVSTTM